MMAVLAAGALGVLEAIYVESPALFERLVALLADRPKHGDVTLRFRDAKLFLVERHEQHRD